MVSECSEKEISVFAYCHGFLSSAKSTRMGRLLADFFQNELKTTLHLIDMNAEPGKLSTISPKVAIQRIDALYNSFLLEGYVKVSLCLIGSSLGGAVAASYAALYPEKNIKLVLLCPAIDPRTIFLSQVIGESDQEIQRWKTEGYRPFKLMTDSSKTECVPYSFFEELAMLSPPPLYKCPSLVVLAADDDIVTPDYIHKFFDQNPQLKPHTKIVLVQDNHLLGKNSTLDMIYKEIRDFVSDVIPEAK